MVKNICIFSDGTGQMGGARPDQRLSNVYKMYRAMRPGPDSPISPKDQVAFYDPGLGTGERGGFFGRIKPILESAVGTGIDHNIIDCYEQIIAHYEPGDRVLLFGFSRGAYTVRALANVMNLCGVPTQMPDGSPVPRYGPGLRKIAKDAVKFVYNHGAGKPRGQDPYCEQACNFDPVEG
ncbi:MULTISPECIES: phospholipase effector Tle1 domain-containing protein [unclassified Sulfitobacter]|uniref:phospholipase effector Tle1 domain-containing protein n=1 Tax=unclassified Sulfitobacter TaxID=196795 RepID=UPI0037474650